MFTCVIFVCAGRNEEDTRESKKGKPRLFPTHIISLNLSTQKMWIHKNCVYNWGKLEAVLYMEVFVSVSIHDSYIHA